MFGTKVALKKKISLATVVVGEDHMFDKHLALKVIVVGIGVGSLLGHC